MMNLLRTKRGKLLFSTTRISLTHWAALIAVWASPALHFGEDLPLPPEEAAHTMVVPEGFRVTLFAGEPDVQQPIGFCMDDRGRLWVAEAYNYPNHTTEPGDRIVILEDADGDGRFDKRTVFYDQLNYVTGIEVGFGGAWVMSPPYFYFIPDRDGDDRPDRQPEVLLDGFGNHANAHNLANGFAWGPDGWLYGTHGRTNWSMIGKPGTKDNERTRFDGGVFRYHPIRHVWEPFADGTTNPWGIDWNDHGQAFVCNCVNPHLFHVIQGAHYEPWRNRKSSQFAYRRIPTIADHLHFVGKGNVRDGLGSEEEDVAGGGHAHCGTMVYLGDNWPDRYRNMVFMNNIHGRRINQDLLRRQGSGYTASHGSDVMRSQDPWFMGVTLTYGFDGSVFVSDWSDTGECHSVRNTRRHTGRIYRISYGDPETKPVHISALSDDQLVTLHLHRNDRFVRHARRVLQERCAVNQDMANVHRQLHQLFANNQNVTRKLRALWTLHATDGLDDAFLIDQLGHGDEHIRAWAVRLLCENGSVNEDALASFCELAETGDSQLVRLHLSSALQRLAAHQRWPLAEFLAARHDDRNDQNLPLMIWYGLEPLLDDDLPRYVKLAATAKIPLIRNHMARRIASSDHWKVGVGLLIAQLGATSDEIRHDLLEGILKGLEGRRRVSMPDAWTAARSGLAASDSASVRSMSQRLALKFDDPVAVELLRQQASDTSAARADREEAIAALVAKKVPGLATLLIRLVDDDDARVAAIRGLAEYDNSSTPATLVNAYAGMDALSRQQTLLTLASRAEWARELLSAVESDRIPRQDLTAFTARQLHSLGDEGVMQKLRKVWGEVRQTSAERQKMIRRLRRQLTPKSLSKADLTLGRSLFKQHCANCHKFFESGGSIGPDITGAQRRNIEYLLENLVDPSASVSRDFQMEIIETSSGRVVNGLIVAESKQALTVQTPKERLVLPLDEIESRKVSALSMMPDGLLSPLTTSQILDLFGYLASPKQVPLPTTEVDQTKH